MTDYPMTPEETKVVIANMKTFRSKLQQEEAERRLNPMGLHKLCPITFVAMTLCSCRKCQEERVFK